MTDLRTAAQQALEALEAMTKHFGFARLGSSSLADTMKRGDAHVAMNNLRAALAEPVQEPWEHLKQYGYAPGSYMSRCHSCDKIASGVDKRAITCRPCAEVRHAESQKAEPVLNPAPGYCKHCKRAHKIGVQP